MKRLKEILINSITGISKAGFRFPMTVISLVAAAINRFRAIAIEGTPSVLLEKLIFTFIIAAILGMVAQFAVERFESLTKKRTLVYGISSLLVVGYFLILLPAPEMSDEIALRSFVAIFALVCMALWIPPYKSEVKFNVVALVHFKSSLIALLYSVVLSLGIAAIIAAVDTLLFKINYHAYAYMMTVIWIVFAPIYYLSLLPKFSSKDEIDESMFKQASNYPKLLDILVSKIAIPLVSAYTLVLIIYFIKILFTRTWPSGQVGPMVLVYSIAGILVYVLSSLLENRFTVFYRKLFPKILIPIVMMQLIAVGIRLNSYGITVSRYYVIIFGVYAAIVGGILSFRPTLENGKIALLAAIFAVISIMPPVDAFTISRNSQISRLETMLKEEGMLAEGKIISNKDATEQAKIEITNILYYLQRTSSLKYIEWLPEDFVIYEDFKDVFGFETTYPMYEYGEERYIDVLLDEREPIPLLGYDILLTGFIDEYSYQKGTKDVDFTLNAQNYVLKVSKTSGDGGRIAILDSSGAEIIGTELSEYAKDIADKIGTSKKALSPEEMSLELENNGYKLKIIFKNVSYVKRTTAESSINYGMYVLFTAPK